MSAPLGRVATTSATPAVATSVSQRARRHRIVLAALEALQQRSYDQIQMRDVATDAGVALGTVYRYFPSKEQLFAQVLLEWSASFDEAVRRRRSRQHDDAGRLRLVLRRAVGAFERHPNFFQLITVLEVSRDPAVVAPFAEHSERFSAALAENLTDVHPDDVPVVTGLAIGLLDSLLRGWWLGHLPMREVQDRIDRSVAVMFEGPRPPAG